MVLIIQVKKLKNRLHGMKNMHREYGQNREGHAAKVYFNSLFGKGFSRDDMSSVNAALNYGYGILLSNFNKEIVADGYLTQLGIKHINEYNLTNAIQIYLDKIFDAIEHESFDTSILYEFA